MIKLPGKAATSSANQEAIIIENPENEALVSREMNQPLSAGSTVSFEVEVNETRTFAVWLLGNGSWDYEYYAKQYKNTTSTGTISVVIPADMDYYSILVQYRNADGSPDQTSDKTGLVATIKNLNVMQGSQIESGAIKLVNVDGGPLQRHYIYDDIPMGSTLSFDIDFNLNEQCAIWVIGDDDWDSSASGGGEFFVKLYPTWTEQQHLVVTTTKDVSNIQICVKFWGPNASNTTNMAIIRNLELEHASIEPIEGVDLRYSSQVTSCAIDDSSRYHIYLDGFTDTQRVEMKGIKPTIWIDGKEVGHEQMFCEETSVSGVTLLTIPYDVLETGKVTHATLEMPHVLWLKAGSTIGNYIISKDVILKLDGASVSPVTATPTKLSWVKGSVQDNNKRYLITLNSGQTSLTTNSEKRLIIDGQYRNSYTQCGYADKAAAADGTRDIYFYIGYSDLETQATTSWTELTKSHTIVIKAGTIVLGHMIEEDFGIRLSGNSLAYFNPSQIKVIPPKTVTLEPLYINVDEDTTYTIPSTPIEEDKDVTIKVNGEITAEYTLHEPGTYTVERIMENTVLAEAVSTVGDITYTQTIHLFETGDVNLDQIVSAVDVVHLKKSIHQAEAIPGASDLNYDEEISTEDLKILHQLFIDETTVDEICNQNDSVVFGAISDIHYRGNGRDGQKRINLRKALNYYKSQNVDAILFNGDLTDLGEVSGYQQLVSDIQSVYPDEADRPELIFVGDNHEWYDAWTVNGHIPICDFATTQQRFVDELAELRNDATSTNTYTSVKGYAFIGVTSDGMNGGEATYSEATIQWVEACLKDALSADATGKKPIFLAIHQPPANTVYGSDIKHHDSSTLDMLLKNYPQIVMITSHTHAPIQDERAIYQGDYTVLNTGGLYYVSGVVNEAANVGGLTTMSPAYQFGQGLLICANKNTVEIKRCDFYHDEKMKEDWKVVTSDNAKDYTTYTDVRAQERAAPTFPSGTSVQAAWKDDTTATLTFLAATHDDFVHHYIVKVYDNTASTLKTYTYSSMFYLGIDSLPDTVAFEVNNLNSQNSYQFEIQAIESWGNSSTAITGTLTTS